MVSVQNVCFSYSKKGPLFNDLNLTLQPGCIYGLLGRNGSGKTTLLRLMSGLLFPQKGTCQMGEHVPMQRKPAFLQDVFFIPEEFDLPPVQIGNYVRVNAPFYPKFNHAQFLAHMLEFDLHAGLYMHQLSHGQKKKALTCFALATNTALLIMDEPTNGLDIPSKARFRRLIAATLHEERVVIVSTHQVRDLEQLIDPIIILENNRILLHATIEKISRRFRFSTVGQLPESSKSVLYSEPGIRGISVVEASAGAESGRVDIEMLFNAALQHPEAVEAAMQPVSALSL